MLFWKPVLERQTRISLKLDTSIVFVVGVHLPSTCIYRARHAICPYLLEASLRGGEQKYSHDGLTRLHSCLSRFAPIPSMSEAHKPVTSRNMPQSE